MDPSRRHHKKGTLVSRNEFNSIEALAFSPRHQELVMMLPESRNWAIYDDVDTMGSKELRRVMDLERRHLEKNRVRKMPQIPESGDSEGGELKMLPESSEVEVFGHVDNTGLPMKSR